MRTSALIEAALTLANDLAKAEMSDLPPGGYPPIMTIDCDGWTCDGYTTPATVEVKIRMRVQDPFFNTDFGSYEGILISANAQMIYIGTK